MSFPDNLQRDRELAGLLASSRRKIASLLPMKPPRWIQIDSLRQRLILVRDDAEWLSWSISTAAAGIDGRQDSGGTPPGLHRIDERIGEGQPVGTVFESREPTGRVWSPNSPAPAAGPEPHSDLILTRLLTLEGLENGVNRGPGCDSRQRYIYIHGTNCEAEIGRPVSHGCIRMRNLDMIELFDLVAEGDPVVIV